MKVAQRDISANRTALLSGLKGAVIAALVFGFSLQAQAECVPGACVNVRVSRLYTNATSDGTVYVQVDAPLTNVNCAPVSGVYLTLPPASPRFKEIYGTLLAYQLADRSVSIRVEDGSAGCSILYIYVDS